MIEVSNHTNKLFFQENLQADKTLAEVETKKSKKSEEPKATSSKEKKEIELEV